MLLTFLVRLIYNCTYMRFQNFAWIFFSLEIRLGIMYSIVFFSLHFFSKSKLNQWNVTHMLSIMVSLLTTNFSFFNLSTNCISAKINNQQNKTKYNILHIMKWDWHMIDERMIINRWIKNRHDTRIHSGDFLFRMISSLVLYTTFV